MINNYSPSSAGAAGRSVCARGNHILPVTTSAPRRKPRAVGGEVESAQVELARLRHRLGDSSLTTRLLAATLVREPEKARRVTSICARYRDEPGTAITKLAVLIPDVAEQAVPHSD